jgi:hypothetical protein
MADESSVQEIRPMFQERSNIVGWEMRSAFLLAGLALLASVLLDIHELRAGPGIGRLRTAWHLGWDFLYAAIAVGGICVAIAGTMPQRKTASWTKSD